MPRSGWSPILFLGSAAAMLPTVAATVAETATATPTTVLVNATAGALQAVGDAVPTAVAAAAAVNVVSIVLEWVSTETQKNLAKLGVRLAKLPPVELEDGETVRIEDDGAVRVAGSDYAFYMPVEPKLIFPNVVQCGGYGTLMRGVDGNLMYFSRMRSVGRLDDLNIVLQASDKLYVVPRTFKESDIAPLGCGEALEAKVFSLPGKAWRVCHVVFARASFGDQPGTAVVGLSDSGAVVWQQAIEGVVADLAMFIPDNGQVVLTAPLPGHGKQAFRFYAETGFYLGVTSHYPQSQDKVDDRHVSGDVLVGDDAAVTRHGERPMLELPVNVRLCEHGAGTPFRITDFTPPTPAPTPTPTSSPPLATTPSSTPPVSVSAQQSGSSLFSAWGVSIATLLTGITSLLCYRRSKSSDSVLGNHLHRSPSISSGNLDSMWSSGVATVVNSDSDTGGSSGDRSPSPVRRKPRTRSQSGARKRLAMS